MVFLLGLGSQTEIFGEAHPNPKSALKISIATDPHRVDTNRLFTLMRIRLLSLILIRILI
jgi:hypothetical protein